MADHNFWWKTQQQKKDKKKIELQAHLFCGRVLLILKRHQHQNHHHRRCLTCQHETAAIFFPKNTTLSHSKIFYKHTIACPVYVTMWLFVCVSVCLLACCIPPEPPNSTSAVYHLSSQNMFACYTLLLHQPASRTLTHFICLCWWEKSRINNNNKNNYNCNNVRRNNSYPVIANFGKYGP